MNTTDIMIHIDDELDTLQRKRLESELRTLPGVIAPRFNKTHLLVVLYDAGATKAQELLNAVTAHGHRAQLVGG